MSPGWSDDTGDYGRLLCRHINKATFFKNVKKGEGQDDKRRQLTVF